MMKVIVSHLNFSILIFFTLLSFQNFSIVWGQEQKGSISFVQLYLECEFDPSGPSCNSPPPPPGGGGSESPPDPFFNAPHYNPRSDSKVQSLDKGFNQLGDDLSRSNQENEKLKSSLDHFENELESQSVGTKNIERNIEDLEKKTFEIEQSLRQEDEQRNRSSEPVAHLQRDSIIQSITETQPKDPNWDVVRDSFHRLLSLRSNLENLSDFESIPYLEMRQMLLKKAEQFFLTADHSYFNKEIKVGDGYIELGHILLDQVLNFDPNFNIRDHWSLIPDIPESEWPYEFQMEEGENKTTLTSIYGDLLKLSPRSPRDRVIKTLGIRSVQLADEAYFQGNEEEGELATHVAETMLDLALSFIPVVGWGKDIFEAISGRNLVTGKKLTSSERLFAAVGSLTFGYGGKVGKGIQEIYSRSHTVGVFLKKVSNNGYGRLKEFISSARKYGGIRNAEDLKGYTKIYENVKGLPQAVKGIQVENIRVGEGDKLALIGRKMGGENQKAGVIEAKKYFEKKGMDVEIFNDEVELNNFKKYIQNNPDLLDKTGRLPNDVVQRTSLYKNNQKWAEKLKVENYTILDLGQNKVKETSAFYEMEKEILFSN